MRDFIIIATIIFAITWGSRCSLHYYEQLQNMMKTELTTWEEHFYDDSQKEVSVHKLEEIWLANEDWLIILQDHASMDEIENHLYECFHYYREGDFNRFKLFKEKVLSGFEDIVKREKLLLVDIL